MARFSFWKGTKTEDLLNFSESQLSSMTTSRLRELVQKLASVGNKRMKALDKVGFRTQAVIGAEKSGGKFTTRGKSRAELIMEYLREKNFLKHPTSTIKGTKKLAKEIRELVGLDVDESELEGLSTYMHYAEEQNIANYMTSFQYADYVKEIYADAMGNGWSHEKLMDKLDEDIADMRRKQNARGRGKFDVSASTIISSI